MLLTPHVFLIFLLLIFHLYCVIVTPGEQSMGLIWPDVTPNSFAAPLYILGQAEMSQMRCLFFFSSYVINFLFREKNSWDCFCSRVQFHLDKNKATRTHTPPSLLPREPLSFNLTRTLFIHYLFSGSAIVAGHCKEGWFVTPYPSALLSLLWKAAVLCMCL